MYLIWGFTYYINVNVFVVSVQAIPSIRAASPLINQQPPSSAPSNTPRTTSSRLVNPCPQTTCPSNRSAPRLPWCSKLACPRIHSVNITLSGYWRPTRPHPLYKSVPRLMPTHPIQCLPCPRMIRFRLIAPRLMRTLHRLC